MTTSTSEPSESRPTTSDDARRRLPEPLLVRSVLKWQMTAPVMEFNMPADARVIDVRTQDNVPNLWTLGTNNHPVKRRTFVGFGTGHPIIESGLEYVGSAHDVDGWMVFHIFERVLP